MPYYTDDFMFDVMKIEELPQFLYHYTSLETLACILKYKKLRFTRLDLVNDKNEARSIDIKKANSLVFVSCWTNNENESIPMWNMYTNGMSGVRIKVPINLFKGRREPIIFERGGARIITDSNFYTIERESPASGINGKSIIGPNKIHYSNESKYLETKCIEKVDNLLNIDLSDLGMFKNLSWAYEDEWRFRILGMIDSYYPDDDFTKTVILDLEKYKVIPTYIDIEIDSDIFNVLEITTGPKITDPQMIILESLIEKYAPKTTIYNSQLSIR